jgi:glyoxylase-like metal-dependent hydrolase (beta-lactamase superfamily II)
VKTGKYQIDILHEGTMRVDGGVTFGTLPKTVWEKFAHPDENNRISLGLNQLLIRGEKLNILVDTGMGSKLRPRKKQVMGITQNSSIEERLKNFNLGLADITHVVFTHLHYDHAGGATVIDEKNDEVFSIFPDAVFVIQKNEWQAASNPDDISRLCYYLHDFIPLCQTGRLQLINGDLELADGIFLEVTGGHTAAHQLVRIEDEKHQVIFPGDICPTRWHLNPESRESFDLFPYETMQSRRRLVSEACKNNSLIAFSHGIKPAFYQLEGKPDKPEAKEFNET